MQLISRQHDVLWPKLPQLSVYDVVDDESTERRMQQFVRNRWSFPMTLYMEAHSSDEETLLNLSLPLQKMRSIKKNLYITNQGWVREYIPAYKLIIEDEEILKEAFHELFYVAEQNFLFALTNESSLFYKGYSLTTTSDTIEIVTADYDGQGVIFMTKGRD